MLDLDFAFFNIMNTDRRGLFSQKAILERLAPVFFAPRVERMIDLPDLRARGCNITIPLGAGNLTVLDQETRNTMAAKSNHLISDYQLPWMAVDRRLKASRSDLLPAMNLVFGDHFVKALAAALVARIMSWRELNKVIIVGELDHPGRFAARLCEYGLPVSIQSYHPARYEVLNYRLRYEQGYAVSTSYLDPHNWKKGDLVLAFDAEGARLVCQAPEAFCLRFDNESRGLSPQLENGLLSNGIDSGLYNLAPIVETCLWSQAGFLDKDAEQAKCKQLEPGDEDEKFLALQTLGDSIGLWDIFLPLGGFLDKAL